MRRIVIWASSTIAGLVMLFGYHTSTSGVAASEPATVVVGTSTIGTTTSGSGSGPGTSSTSGSTTYTGETAQTRWGPVQVAVDVANGTIEAVNVLQYPNDNPKDVEINNYALPVLVEETMSAQSANVDMIGGATITSLGYQQSLQSALDQAGL